MNHDHTVTALALFARDVLTGGFDPVEFVLIAQELGLVEPDDEVIKLDRDFLNLLYEIEGYE